MIAFNQLMTLKRQNYQILVLDTTKCQDCCNTYECE